MLTTETPINTRITSEPMSYRYDAPYDSYSQIVYVLPHPNFDFVIHLNSIVAQLEFTLEEIASILRKQQEWCKVCIG
jgi:hypothetical protein